jgi:hypothetical protein
MTGKVIKFRVPEKVRYRYVEPEDLDAPMDIFDFDVRKALGPMGKLIQDHKHLVLNWLQNGEFLKPMDEWSENAKVAVIAQRLAFNSTLNSMVKDVPVTLLGGEEAILKRANFVIRDITDDRQELARIVGIVSEVLFFEGVVYIPETMSYLTVEDYQIKEARFPRIRKKNKK